MSAPSTVPARQSRHTFSWLLLIAANVLWAASYVAAKFALQDTSVNVMLALRMGISALVLLPFLIARRKQLKLTPKQPAKKPPERRPADDRVRDETREALPELQGELRSIHTRSPARRPSDLAALPRLTAIATLP